MSKTTKVMDIIRTHRELKVYRLALFNAMRIYTLTKSFPRDESFSLTDQIRRSSRSVCSNIAEAFRRRKYPKSFSSKLNESEAEAAETQNWLDFSMECKYITQETHQSINKEYENILGMLVTMQMQPEKWGI